VLLRKLVRIINTLIAVAAILAIAAGYWFLWRPMPVDNPDQLVALYQTAGKGTTEFRDFSYPELMDYARQMDGFSDLMGSSGVPLRVTGGEQPELIWGQVVTGNFVSGLRLHMVAGRGFLPEEDRNVGARPVALLPLRPPSGPRSGELRRDWGSGSHRASPSASIVSN